MDGNMPPLVNPPGGGGFISHPPDTHFDEQPGGFNPFPGAAQANPGWPLPATAPFWPNFGPPSPSPWASDAGAVWPPSQYGPWTPYSHPTPAPSWGQYTPATLSPPTPGLGRPIGASPYLNAAGGNGNQWPPNVNAGPERRRRLSFGGNSPRHGEVPMERTHSQDPPYPYGPWFDGYSAGTPLQRAWSTGATSSRSRIGSPFAPAYLEQYNSENLARRPKDWRPDYLKTLIPRMPRPKSYIEEFKIRHRINEILSYDPQDPKVIYELSSYPHPRTLSFPILRRVYNHIDFAQLATNPPVDEMRLFHNLLPWYIDVHKTIDNGVTVQDVIMQVYFQLQTQINARHYFNKKLGGETRERIARAFQRRTQGKNDEKVKGIKKVDYLEEKNIFVGLVKTMDGMWEMKTISF